MQQGLYQGVYIAGFIHCHLPCLGVLKITDQEYGGPLAQAEKKIAQFQKVIGEKDCIIKKLSDQLA